MTALRRQPKVSFDRCWRRRKCDGLPRAQRRLPTWAAPIQGHRRPEQSWKSSVLAGPVIEAVTYIVGRLSAASR